MSNCPNNSRVLVINPGSTSTKIAVYDGCSVLFEEVIAHAIEEVSVFDKVIDQYDFRIGKIKEVIASKGFDMTTLTAVIGRGGALKPVESGTYEVNAAMIDDLVNRPYYQHVSNLGAIIAKDIADEYNLKSYIADPLTVDELCDLARLSGAPELPRKSVLHALSVKATLRKTALDLDKSIENISMIVGHLGGGITIAAIENGRIIDVNNANEEGPFSAERSGGITVDDILEMCYSGKYTHKEMQDKIIKKGGLVAYLGTNDARTVEEMVKAGDKKATEVFSAMAYQIAKEIGAMATVLSGKVDAIALTGGLSNWGMLVDAIKGYCSFIADVYVYPGENEMIALSQAAQRVIHGREEVKVYA